MGYGQLCREATTGAGLLLSEAFPSHAELAGRGDLGCDSRPVAAAEAYGDYEE